MLSRKGLSDLVLATLLFMAIFASGLGEPIAILAGLNAPSGAAPAVEWDRTYASRGAAYSVQQTSDEGFIVAGDISSSGAMYMDFLLVKTDANGTMEWSQTYGGTYGDRGNSVQQTSDGGYIVAGYTNFALGGSGDVWLVKTDANGSMEWSRTYGPGNDFGYSVQQTSDGGFIVAGVTWPYYADVSDMLLVKTDASGTMEWTRTYGGTSFDGANCVQQTSDGGFIVAGYTYSYGAPCDPEGSTCSDVWLVKTSSTGMMEWSRTYGGAYDNAASSVQQTSDGGYILAGNIESMNPFDWNAWVVKTDASGNMVWSLTYGGAELDVGNCVRQTTDGGYIMTGWTKSYGAGEEDMFLVKTSASGSIEWSQTYGGTGYDGANSASQTIDGGYIVAGYTTYGASTSVRLIKLAGSEDTDGDGLLDNWEQTGLDYNHDGIIDLDLPALGADWQHKDVFVEVDYMGWALTHDHKPMVEAISDVKMAFALAPVKNPDGHDGITLHVEVDEEFPHSYLFEMWNDFDERKTLSFGTPDQRSSPNKDHILAAKRLVYRYCLFIHQQTDPWNGTGFPLDPSSGRAEIWGNDFVVSLGDFTDHMGSRDEQAGAFMHELGHTLGLHDGGADDIYFKPNYLSVMNYAFTFSNLVPPRPLDYSRKELPTLNEIGLDEWAGIGANVAQYTVFNDSVDVVVTYGWLPIDWNGDNDTTDSGVQGNINDYPGWGYDSAPFEVLTGYDDWSHLKYDFRDSGHFADGVHSITTDKEMTWQTVEAMREEAKRRHAVGAIDLSAPPGVVDQTGVTVNLTLVNLGGNTEDLNVTVYANTTAIASEMLALPGANITAIRLPCITTGLRIGNYTLCAKISPLANETYTADNTVIGRIITVVDKTPPTIAVASPAPGTPVNSSTITVAWTGSDVNSGVAGYEVRLDGGVWTSVGTDTSREFTGLSDGSHRVDIRATDMEGNTKMATVNFTVDVVPPSTVVKPGSGEDWYNASTRIELDASDPDPGSGVKCTFYRIDDGRASNATDWPFGFDAPEGRHTYTFWSQDEAGNVETAQTSVIKVDTRPPTTAISPPPNPGNDSYPPPLTIHLFAQDAEPGSGVSRTFYSIDSQSGLEYRPDGFQALEGEHLYTYWSVDCAGNHELEKQALIKVGIPEASPLIFAGLLLLGQLLSLRIASDMP